jgi:hypothetical protein
MAGGKQRTEEHLIDADGKRLLESLLPRNWVIREYRPDYGLDFSVEIFGQRDPSDPAKGHETLGEHLFLQLKSTAQPTKGLLQLHARKNVEKGPEFLETNSPVGEIETVRCQLETSELITVERMGVGVPVLLVIADLPSKDCFFVCLNDYIDKILIPRHGNYADKNTRVIHVPTHNRLSSDSCGTEVLRWYSKRAKLYAAFQRFHYQHIELEHEREGPDFMKLAAYFAIRIAAYDFWGDTAMWPLIGRCGSALRRFVATGAPGLHLPENSAIDKLTQDSDERKDLLDWLHLVDVSELWRQLTVLSRVYEDLCREWFLPTAVGYLSSFEDPKAGSK